MGFGDKFKDWLNGGTDAVDVDRDDVNDLEDNDMAHELNYNQSNMSLDGAIELKVVKPERFESVSQIADHLLSRRTVVLNLENTNKETARRLIDFLSGVAYSINGQLKKIASNAYVITPDNVDVSGEQLRERSLEQAPVQEQAPDYNEDTAF
jgi:cell division inhibitor SepF